MSVLPANIQLIPTIISDTGSSSRLPAKWPKWPHIAWQDKMQYSKASSMGNTLETLISMHEKCLKLTHAYHRYVSSSKRYPQFNYGACRTVIKRIDSFRLKFDKNCSLSEKKKQTTFDSNISAIFLADGLFSCKKHSHKKTTMTFPICHGYSGDAGLLFYSH